MNQAIKNNDWGRYYTTVLGQQKRYLDNYMNGDEQSRSKYILNGIDFDDNGDINRNTNNRINQLTDNAYNSLNQNSGATKEQKRAAAAAARAYVGTPLTNLTTLEKSPNASVAHNAFESSRPRAAQIHYDLDRPLSERLQTYKSRKELNSLWNS